MAFVVLAVMIGNAIGTKSIADEDSGVRESHEADQAVAAGTITVVAIAVAGSLTVLPAVLSRLGDRVNKGRI